MNMLPRQLASVSWSECNGYAMGYLLLYGRDSRFNQEKIDAKIASSRRYSLWRLKALKCYKKILHAIIALGGGFKTPSTFMENISLMTRFSRQFSNSPTHPPLTRKSRVRFFITTSKPSIFMENISLVTLFSRQFFLDWSENLVHRGVDIPSRSHCTHFMPCPP